MPQQRNVKITIEYDGTDYFGWQLQPHHVTVQQRLEEAVEAVTQAHSSVTGSGRTDAGVHARGQVANFRTQSNIPADKFPYALNANLPHDIAVVHAKDVPWEFHARYDAKAKAYRYTIINQPMPSPLMRRYAWRIAPKLDLARMAEAAAQLIGEHDFSAFRSEASPDRSSVRTVTRAEFVADGARLDFWIEANGFLYNMVRAIVGTLALVGRGKIRVDEFVAISESADRSAAGPTAPPQGLCLMEVRY